MATIPQAPELRAPQQPDWPSYEAVAEVRRTLAAREALVTEEESRDALARLARASRGDALVLQGGDCAERLADAGPAVTAAKVRQLHGLAELVRSASGLEAVPVGRLGGQYAKPRSHRVEVLPDGRDAPAYRGDAVNSLSPHGSARQADPARLLLAHDAAAAVLGAVRDSWATAPGQPRVLASHEALLLDYEEPLVREGRDGPYAASGHFLWIGDRTRSPHGAHIRLASTLTNPIGVKLGPAASPRQAAELSRILNPEGVDGRLTFIARLGVKRVDELLPDLVAEVAHRGAPALWLCDPMHGNTVVGPAGYKTRLMGDILCEARAFARIQRRSGRHPGGLHLEVTPDRVDECVDSMPGTTDQWPRSYRSACDPRLTTAQAQRVVQDFSNQL